MYETLLSNYGIKLQANVGNASTTTSVGKVRNSPQAQKAPKRAPAAVRGKECE